MTLWQRIPSVLSFLAWSFIEHSVTLHGRHFVTYNIHNLIHLPYEFNRNGSLDKFFSFPFEKFLGSLKRILRSGNHPLEQITARLRENIPFVAVKTSKLSIFDENIKGYRKIVHATFLIKANSKDRCNFPFWIRTTWKWRYCITCQRSEGAQWSVFLSCKCKS